jgi:hypothetical protein
VLIPAAGRWRTWFVLHLRYSPVESLDHAVGLRVSGANQAVLDSQRLALAVKGVLA